MTSQATVVRSHPAMPPISLGKYENLVQIGAGGMSRVYRAYDPVLDRPVAIKVIATAAPGESGNPLRRFRREARLVAALNHPNIVIVHDFGEDHGVFYLVMEHLEGADLAEVLRRRLLASVGEKLDLLAQILNAVAFAHRRDMVHQDLKPANVFRLSDGWVKILDFGLARLTAAPVTTAGLSGTPQYISPEQLAGEPADARSDVFSLGALTYELLTGKRCFPAETLEAIFFQILQRQPDSVRRYDPSLPELADRILQKALAKDPGERFADAGELAEAVAWLRRVIAGETAESEAGAALDLDRQALPADVTPSAPLAPATPAAAADTGGRRGARITFVGEDGGDRRIAGDGSQGRTLLELSRAAGIPHYHECGGRARCSTCRVRVLAGSGNLPPRNRAETLLAERLGWAPDIRLACQARPAGDVTVQRLVHDTRDFGLLRFESRKSAPRETALAVLAIRVRNLPLLLERSVPYDVVHVLNRFFLEAGEPVVAAGGHLEPARSDGLTALFGLAGGNAREKCLAAVRTALRIRSRLAELARYTRKYFDFELDLGLALDFGRAVVGELGHPSDTRPAVLGGLTSVARELGAAGDPGLPRAGLLATESVINVLESELRFGEAPPGDYPLLCYEVLDLVKPDAVALVQESFAAVAERPHQAAELFYRLLFEIAPDVEPLFAAADMATQGRKLMDVLSHVVRGLENFEALRSTVEDLGRRHRGYGVEIRHFDAVEQALLETLRQTLGGRWSVDLRIAWSGIYNRLAEVMIEAMEDAAAPAS